LSHGVSGFVCVFSLWDWCTGRGKTIVEHVGLLSFKNCSLAIGLSETCHSWTTYHSWLVGDTNSFGVAILGEGTLDNGNHFLNRTSRIGPK
jgi:hypothetical protein